MSAWRELETALATGPAVQVSVARVEGSGPREVGAWMAVTRRACIGTIGGGAMEFDAIRRAREFLLAGAVGDAMQRCALGPSLGQCCGGVVHLRYDWLANAQGLYRPPSSEMPIALFGGGHVGQAIAHLLARLPCTVQWFDSRDEVFPPALPEHILAEHSDPVQAAVLDLSPGAKVLIMSFSHAEDLDIAAACLLRQRTHGDLPFIGLIGSKSKWASFRQRLLARGFSEAELAQITSPIGLPGITGKQPEVIALAVVAQLLQKP